MWLKDDFDVEVAYSRPHHNVFECPHTHYFSSVADMNNIVTNVDPDIIHVHNTPDWPTISIRKITDYPIIHDIHDFTSDWGTLREACRLSDYIVTVNSDMARDLSNVISRDVQVYHTTPPRKVTQLLKLSEGDGKPHTVFIGSFHYEQVARNSAEAMSRTFKTLKMPIHIHSNFFRSILKEYENDYFILEDEIPFADVPTVLSQYDLGIALPFDTVDSNLSYNYTHMLPSKMFDYWQAGIPTICDGRYATMSTFIDTNEIGISYTHLSRKVIEKAVKTDINTAFQPLTVRDCEPYRGLIE